MAKVHGDADERRGLVALEHLAEEPDARSEVRHAGHGAELREQPVSDLDIGLEAKRIEARARLAAHDLYTADPGLGAHVSDQVHDAGLPRPGEQHRHRAGGQDREREDRPPPLPHEVPESELEEQDKAHQPPRPWAATIAYDRSPCPTQISLIQRV